MFLWYPVMGLARAPTARKKGSGYENERLPNYILSLHYFIFDNNITTHFSSSEVDMESRRMAMHVNCLCKSSIVG
jgi:hypothetical protein